MQIQKYNSNDDLEVLKELKEYLYNILTADEESEQTSITANQSLGVALSNSVKKDGVTIVQMQSVVNKKVTFNVVKALKAIDNLVSSQNVQVISNGLDNEQNMTLADFIKAIEWASVRGLTMKEFERLTKGLLCRKLVKKHSTASRAADVLNVSTSYVSQLAREVDELLPLLDDSKKEIIDVSNKNMGE